MNSILIIGCCGTGKTWVMKRIIKAYKLNAKGCVGLFKFRTNGKMLALGVYDDSTFEGGDKLSMGIMRDCAKFERARDKRGMLAICEGDRFTNKTFIETCKPYIVKIQGDGKEGRIKRNSKQSERHLTAIKTRVNNIDADVIAQDSQEAFDLIESIICKQQI